MRNIEMFQFRFIERAYPATSRNAGEQTAAAFAESIY